MAKKKGPIKFTIDEGSGTQRQPPSQQQGTSQLSQSIAPPPPSFMAPQPQYIPPQSQFIQAQPQPQPQPQPQFIPSQQPFYHPQMYPQYFPQMYYPPSMFSPQLNSPALSFPSGSHQQILPVAHQQMMPGSHQPIMTGPLQQSGIQTVTTMSQQQVTHPQTPLSVNTDTNFLQARPTFVPPSAANQTLPSSAAIIPSLVCANAKTPLTQDASHHPSLPTASTNVSAIPEQASAEKTDVAPVVIIQKQVVPETQRVKKKNINNPPKRKAAVKATASMSKQLTATNEEESDDGTELQETDATTDSGIVASPKKSRVDVAFHTKNPSMLTADIIREHIKNNRIQLAIPDKQTHSSEMWAHGLRMLLWTHNNNHIANWYWCSNPGCEMLWNVELKTAGLKNILEHVKKCGEMNGKSFIVRITRVELATALARATEIGARYGKVSKQAILEIIPRKEPKKRFVEWSIGVLDKMDACSCDSQQQVTMPQCNKPGQLPSESQHVSNEELDGQSRTNQGIISSTIYESTQDHENMLQTSEETPISGISTSTEKSETSPRSEDSHYALTINIRQDKYTKQLIEKARIQGMVQTGSSGSSSEPRPVVLLKPFSPDGKLTGKLKRKKPGPKFSKGSTYVEEQADTDEEEKGATNEIEKEVISEDTNEEEKGAKNEIEKEVMAEDTDEEQKGMTDEEEKEVTDGEEKEVTDGEEEGKRPTDEMEVTAEEARTEESTNEKENIEKDADGNEDKGMEEETNEDANRSTLTIRSDDIVNVPSDVPTNILSGETEDDIDDEMSALQKDIVSAFQTNDDESTDDDEDEPLKKRMKKGHGSPSNDDDVAADEYQT